MSGLGKMFMDIFNFTCIIACVATKAKNTSNMHDVVIIPSGTCIVSGLLYIFITGGF